MHPIESGYQLIKSLVGMTRFIAQEQGSELSGEKRVVIGGELVLLRIWLNVKTVVREGNLKDFYSWNEDIVLFCAPIYCIMHKKAIF